MIYKTADCRLAPASAVLLCLLFYPLFYVLCLFDQLVIFPSPHIVGVEQMVGQMPVGLSQVLVIELHQIRVLMGFAQIIPKANQAPSLSC